MNGLDRILKVIGENLTHKYYPRTVGVAKYARMMNTGVGIDDFIEKRYESDSQKKKDQRKVLTTHISKSVCHDVHSPINSVPKSPSIHLEYSWDDENEERAKLLEDTKKYYNGKYTFDQFFNKVVIRLNRLDPNALIATEAKSFDANIENAKPYPFIIYSDMAVDYKYVNRILQFLTVKTPHSFVVGDTIREESKYTVYQPDGGYVFTPYAETSQDETILFEDQKEIYVKGVAYEVKKFTHNFGEVQAMRVGTFEDEITYEETYVTSLDVCFPYMEQQIFGNSKRDVMMHLMAHPEKIQYAPDCPAEDCYDGLTNEKQTCGLCKGTGLWTAAHTEQDVNLVKVPRDPSKAIPLDKHIHYYFPPVEGMTMIDEYADRLTQKMKSTRYGNNSYNLEDVFETAYKTGISVKSENDALHPIAEKLVQIKEYHLRMIANFLGMGNINTVAYVDEDLRLENLDILMVQKKVLNDAGGNEEIESIIDDKIISYLHSGQPLPIQKNLCRKKLVPFSDKSKEERIMMVNSGRVLKLDIVKMDYSNQIFNQIEFTHGDDFYSEDYEDQYKIFNEEAVKIFNEIEAQKPAIVLPE